MLEGVSQGAYSKWNIVYEPQAKIVRFRTHDRPAIKTIRFGALAGGCETPVKMIDIDTELSGDITDKLVDYEASANRALIEESLAGLRLPSSMASALARYPSALVCTLSASRRAPPR